MDLKTANRSYVRKQVVQVENLVQTGAAPPHRGEKTPSIRQRLRSPTQPQIATERFAVSEGSSSRKGGAAEPSPAGATAPEPVAALNTHGRDRHGNHPGNRFIPTDCHFPKSYNPYKTYKSPETALFDFVHPCGVFRVLPFRLVLQTGLKSKLTRFCVQGTKAPPVFPKRRRGNSRRTPHEGAAARQPCSILR